MSWCPTCHEHVFDGGVTLFGNPHACPPKWKVWDSENGETEEDAEVVRGYSEESAAEKWADKRNRNGDHHIMDSNTATVMVRSADDDDAEAVKIEVRGEMVPTYTTRRV